MRPVDGDHPVLTPVALDDRDGAALDDEEVVAGVAVTEEHLARSHRAELARGPQPRALVVVEPRERAAAVGGLVHAEPERVAHAGAWSTNATSST